MMHALLQVGVFLWQVRLLVSGVQNPPQGYYSLVPCDWPVRVSVRLYPCTPHPLSASTVSVSVVHATGASSTDGGPLVCLMEHFYGQQAAWFM